jgi:16S rRNA (guanine966-N2)-methyltransferase
MTSFSPRSAIPIPAEENMLKISGGTFRSRVIETPEQNTVPTKNRVREAMMSALQNDIPGAIVLDLFAGSGALGIETISRGAKKCYFVDAGKEQAAIIQKNLKTLKIENAEFLGVDYLEALKRLKRDGVKFDVVFLDPPYAEKEFYKASTAFLFENDLLKEDAAVVVEFDGEQHDPFSMFSRQRVYNYGRTHVILMRK